MSQNLAKPNFLIHADLAELATAAAQRCAAVLAETRDRFARPARISLTGGGAGIATARALASLDIDWEGVEIHLGDERFVAPDDSERNFRQLQEVLFDGLSGARCISWPAPGDPGVTDVVSAAQAFAAAHPVPEGTEPYFDLVVLGMGGEGHVNSVFPNTPAVLPEAPAIMAVHNCPKPPPERMTYTLGVVQRSRHVLVVVAGAEKAEAVRLVAENAPSTECPAAGARGREKTEFFLDTAAAEQLPN